MSEPLAARLFSVVVPTRGTPGRLVPLLDALERQTLARFHWELIVVGDGISLEPALAQRLARMDAQALASVDRRGPGAARNRGAAAARAAFLGFTEDDCVPAPDWLERAAVHARAAPAPDVIVGETNRPDGHPVRRHSPAGPHYLPTNLFVRRDAFERAGGYTEAYFDAETGMYFREDSDLGFALEALGTRVVVAADVRVEHPDEHPRFLDPLHWAARYEMDPLLEARYPERFRDRIEVHRLGPFRIRRPVVHASMAFLCALITAVVAMLARAPAVSVAMAALAAATLVPIWAKWGFDPRRLPVVPLVPFVLVAALARGRSRLHRLGDAVTPAAHHPRS